MSPSVREFFRQAILRKLAEARTFAVGLPVLRVNLTADGFTFADDDLRLELAYLRDKGLAVPDAKIVSPENARWRITADGRDYLAQEGLA